MKKHILTADIGGTNSRFAAFSVQGKHITLDRSIWLSTSAADSFEHLLELLANSNFELQPNKADAIIFAVAGPVVDGLKSDPPNIPWDIDLTRVPEKKRGKKALLINDFHAQAYAAFTPAYEDALEIISGTPVESSPIAMIGAGTGLGKSLLVPDFSGNYTPVPSEGGHSFFPFTTKEEIDYAEFLRTKTGSNKIIQDTILSGSGLEHLFEFHTGKKASSPKVVSHFDEHPIVLEWFARFYGRVCHNFVLDTFALGGLYITGGVAAGNPIMIEHEAFHNAFQACEKYGDILCNVPIKLNRNEEAGLWGAAQYGANTLTHTTNSRQIIKG